jgi:hypothetical protein
MPWMRHTHSAQRGVARVGRCNSPARAYLDVLQRVAAGPPGHAPLPIPAFFTDPTPENAIGRDDLERCFAPEPRN